MRAARWPTSTAGAKCPPSSPQARVWRRATQRRSDGYRRGVPASQLQRNATRYYPATGLQFLSRHAGVALAAACEWNPQRILRDWMAE